MKHFDYKKTDKPKMSSRGRPYMQRDKYTQKGMYGVCDCYLLGWKAWQFQESMTQDSYDDVQWYSSIVGKYLKNKHCHTKFVSSTVL